MSTDADIVERLSIVQGVTQPTFRHPLNWQEGREIIKEAAAEITRLRAERDRLLEKGFDLIEQRTTAARVLSFYADPFAWKAAHDPENDISVPDFYSETSFGDTAAEALALLATEGTPS